MFSYSLCVRGCPRSLGNPVPSQLGSLGQTEPLGKGPHTLHFKSMLQTSSPKVKIVFFFSPPPAPTTPYCFCLSFSDDFLSSFLVHETSVICCRHSYLWGQPHSRCHLPKKKKRPLGAGAHWCYPMTQGSRCWCCTMFRKGRLLPSTTDKTVFCLGDETFNEAIS